MDVEFACSAQFPKEPAAPLVPHFPRFRALALFGRRPLQRGRVSLLPAAENLHNFGIDWRGRQPKTCTIGDIAEPYSITSSARASSDGGTVRPSALAVLRLMTNSYLVGACTGRSAGFSPLRMRST